MTMKICVPIAKAVSNQFKSYCWVKDDDTHSRTQPSQPSQHSTAHVCSRSSECTYNIYCLILFSLLTIHQVFKFCCHTLSHTYARVHSLEQHGKVLYGCLYVCYVLITTCNAIMCILPRVAAEEDGDGGRAQNAKLKTRRESHEWMSFFLHILSHLLRTAIDENNSNIHIIRV